MGSQEQLALLKRGVEDWNQWKAEKPKVNVDLSGVDLSNAALEGINLYQANLSGANLSSANLSETNLHRTDLSYAILDGAVLNEVDLSHANLSHADLSYVDLVATNLQCADLSHANLSHADLTSADFSGANLNGADLNSTLIDGDHIKIDAKWRLVLELVNEGGVGRDLNHVNLSYANLNHVNLNYANLDHADLSHANLDHADLSYANLSHADLNGASLVATQVRATNFTGASFTGACLEDWSINSDAKLDDVNCAYFYWKQNEKERRPSSGSFRSGEFILLIQKALETVDLIFADGIDWKAFFASFQELQAEFGDSNLSIQAIEKKSGGAFVICLEVPPEAGKGALESRAKELYEMKLQLLEERYRGELQAKDGQITVCQEWLKAERQDKKDMTGIVKTMAEKENQPTNQTTIHTQTVGVMHTGSGDISHFTQNINQNRDDITKLINSLCESAQSFPEKERQDAQGHLKDLEDDLKQPPNDSTPRRIKATLAALLTIAGMVAASTDFSNNVLEISNKLGIQLIQPHK